jgi:adenylosuccinate synthase
MSNIAVLGAMWGDEGKGHITHRLSRDYDWVIRFNGGANAGHTIYRDGKKFVHNLLPSVDFRHPNVKAYLGSGMVIDLDKLRDEVVEADKTYPGVGKRIYVDKDAFIVEGKHKEEDKSTNAHIGSTNRGIGPAYKDKIGRVGKRIGDCFTQGKPDLISGYSNVLVDLINKGVTFTHVLELEDAFKVSNLLFEGAQGVLLDINHGIYPYVSCSDATVGGIASSGFAFAKLDKVYGVAKCYTTKVGEGPFPTELHGQAADDLRKMGNEFGATTGRPRRVGWLDLAALNYACKKGGITHLILTKFDILDGLPKVPVCVFYKKAPVCPSDFFNAVPLTTEVTGWSDAKDPNQLEGFISLVEKIIKRPVEYISCGTDERDIMDRAA